MVDFYAVHRCLKLMTDQVETIAQLRNMNLKSRMKLNGKKFFPFIRNKQLFVTYQQNIIPSKYIACLLVPKQITSVQ